MYIYTLVQWFLFFYIYCFLGWVWESCYVSVKQKKWVNRGFLHGPFLPIYGSGAIMVLVATLPVKDNLFLVFVFGMIGATVLEYFTGAAMEKMFHVRYWDYSKQPFNIKGYICLTSTIAWGGFSVLMEAVLHQPIERLVLSLPEVVQEMLTLILTIGIAIDTTQSFNEAMDLKEMLINMTENHEEIQRIKKRLESVVMILDEETKQWRQKATEGKQMLSDKLTEEKKKYEDKVKTQLAQKKEKVSFKKRIEINFEQNREKQHSTLHSLSEKMNTYAEMASNYIKSHEDSLSQEVERVTAELKAIKSGLIRQEGKIDNVKKKQILRSVRLLKRNPGAVSAKYKEALARLQELKEK